MARTLFRVSTLAAASAIALGMFAWSSAAPRRPSSSPAQPDPSFTVAALSRHSNEDSLADDAAAAGETGIARDEPYQYQPPRPAPPAVQDDEIVPPLDGAPEERSYAQGYDQPYVSDDSSADQRQVIRPRHRAAEPAHRRIIHHHAVQTAEAAPHPAVHVATPAPPPHPIVRPHRMRIILEPPHKPALTQPGEEAQVSPALPAVEAAPAPDLDTRLAELTRIASADMQGVRVELAPQLSSGREGAVVVTLPPQLLGDLAYKAEDSDPGADARLLSITVRLTGDGWQVVPGEAQTASVAPGHPATFVWRAAPAGAAQGSLSAEMSASLTLDGQPVSLPLGTLTAQLPPPVLGLVPAEPPLAAAPAPEIDNGQPALLDLRRFGLPDLRTLSWRDLDIPGHPTVRIPGLGYVASGKVVAAGLVFLLLLFLRELLHRPIERGQRRRAMREFETAGYGGGYS